MWVIHDLLGYGIAANCKVRGYHPCPVCGEQLTQRYSKALQKCVFTDHQCFFDLNHSFRKLSEILGYEQQFREAPQQLSGEEWETLSKAKTTRIKGESIFFKLPYQKYLLIRHLVDAMHIEKNVSHRTINLMLERTED